MAQVFSPGMNTLARFTIVGGIMLLGVVGIALGMAYRSSFVWQVDYPRDQIVQFSHAHHVSGLGIDCRYCHTSVDTSNFAGIPPTETCMTCHSQVWTDAPILEPVRESWRTDQPLRWVRVHDLPDFAYFDHSIHVNKGIGCSTCHGRIDQMPLVRKVESLQMQWCIECHRAPEKFIRPKDKVYEMDYVPEEPQEVLGPRLVKEYDIHVEQLLNCSICHR